jgi:hypothetical protein
MYIKGIYSIKWIKDRDHLDHDQKKNLDHDRFRSDSKKELMQFYCSRSIRINSKI